VGERRRTLGFVGGLSACVVAGLATAGSAFGLVAPVTAGPPVRPALAHLDFNGFFPASTEIHVGDSVKWSINGFHSVTFLAKGQALPPLIITSAANPISGQLDAGGKPFWFNGQPSLIINPQAAAPAGTKTYKGGTFLSSGLPSQGPPKPFVVKFAKAGTFTFHCVVHPGMSGVVRVLPKRKHVPSVKKDLKAAAAQLKAGIVKARVLAKVKPAAATVLAGNDAGSVAWLRFFPSNMTVKAGTSVEFKIASKREVHTITFGPAAYTESIEKTFTAPIMSATPGPPTIGVNPLGGYPSDPPPLPPFTGSNHGNGFEGSGVLSMGGPGPSSVKITFAKPGVYDFECVIHENMDGKITVTP
jgi:plastocyanin